MFATLAMRKGRLLDADAHMDRLAAAAGAIGLSVPDSVSSAGRLREVLALLGAHRAPQAVVRVQISGDAGGRGFSRGETGSWELVEIHPVPRPRILTVQVLDEDESPVPALPAVKTCSSIAHVLCAGAAARRGVTDAIRTVDGLLLEASASNLFWAAGGTLYTPCSTLPLYPGVTRSATIEVAHRSGWTVEEGEFGRSALSGIAAAFLTNATRGLEPIAELDGAPLSWPGELEDLRAAVEAARLDGGLPIAGCDEGATETGTPR